MMQVLVGSRKLAFEPLSSCALQHDAQRARQQLQKAES
jgi:hypothetical protein